MNVEFANLLSVLDDRIDSLKRMSPVIESEVVRAEQARATAVDLIEETQ